MSRDNNGYNKKLEKIGKRYGRLLVLDILPNNKYGTMYLCLCDCGNQKPIRGCSLGGGTVSCGCRSYEIMHKTPEDLTGRKVGDGGTVLGRSHKKAYWEVKCSCGKVFSTHRKMIVGYKNKRPIEGCIYCGSIRKGLKIRGEKHHNWNNELTDEDRKKNESRCRKVEYRHFRKRILERDDYTCIKCGYKADKYMIVHHLDSWDVNKELRTEESNAVVLCPNCHDSGKPNSFHTIYKCGKNTREQFEEFLGRKLYIMNKPVKSGLKLISKFF